MSLAFFPGGSGPSALEKKSLGKQDDINSIEATRGQQSVSYGQRHLRVVLCPRQPWALSQSGGSQTPEGSGMHLVFVWGLLILLTACRLQSSSWRITAQGKIHFPVACGPCGLRQISVFLSLGLQSTDHDSPPSSMAGFRHQ